MTSTGFWSCLTSRSMEIVFQHNTLNKLLIFPQVRLNVYVNIRINKVQTLKSTVVSRIDNAKKLAQSRSRPRAARVPSGARLAYRRSHAITFPSNVSSYTSRFPQTPFLALTLIHNPTTMTTISNLTLREDRSRSKYTM